MEVEHEGEAGGKHGHAAAGDAVGAGVIRVFVLQALEVCCEAGDVDACGGSGHGGEWEAGVFEELVGHFEEDALLWVHRVGFGWVEVEEGGGEGAEVLGEEVGRGAGDGAGPGEVWVVVGGEGEAVRGDGV